jgi:hypothetical protein
MFKYIKKFFRILIYPFAFVIVLITELGKWLFRVFDTFINYMTDKLIWLFSQIIDLLSIIFKYIKSFLLLLFKPIYRLLSYLFKPRYSSSRMSFFVG